MSNPVFTRVIKGACFNFKMGLYIFLHVLLLNHETIINPCSDNEMHHNRVTPNFMPI